MITLFLYAYGLSAQSHKDTLAFRFMTMDSVFVDTYVQQDPDDGLPIYHSSISTPICEEEQCYSVEVKFYWDALGKFIKFDTLPGKPLTKLEHEPFTTEDYKRLTELLKLTEPAFAGMKKEELISDTKVETLDGYTGATIEAIKNEVIPGAVYSCYVLWHIANGGVQNHIQTVTAANLSAENVKAFVRKNDEQAAYFLIDNFHDEDFSSYAAEVIYLVKNGDGYLPKYVIEKVPDALMERLNFQNNLSAVYVNLDYHTKRSLITRMEGNLRSDSLAVKLIGDLSSENIARHQNIINLLIDDPIRLSKSTLQYLNAVIDKQVIPLNKSQKRFFRKQLQSK